MTTATTTPTISRVRSAQIYCGDQDRAKRFWTDTLGCELIQDEPMGPDASAKRWIEVRPPGDDTILVLYTPDGQEDRIGTFSSLIFHCADIVATHAALVAKGVEFEAEPKKESWGSWWAEFKDPDGNRYGLGQD
jgi:catechol 2,3-dioxygenase-like lactoylglutathione lyase family enzyme